MSLGAKGGDVLRSERVPGQPSIARLEGFSDGVFAFSVTLLVLTLTVPKVEDAIGGANLRAALAAQWPQFVIYLISFFMVGQVWIGHHFLFSNFKSADNWLLWINTLFLTTVAIIPFSTELLGTYAAHQHDRVVAALVYGGIWAIGAWCLTGAFWYASWNGRLLHDGHDAKLIAQLRTYSAVGPLVYTAFTLLALVNFWLSLAGFAFVPLFYLFQGTRGASEKRPA